VSTTNYVKQITGGMIDSGVAIGPGVNKE